MKKQSPIFFVLVFAAGLGLGVLAGIIAGRGAAGPAVMPAQSEPVAETEQPAPRAAPLPSPGAKTSRPDPAADLMKAIATIPREPVEITKGTGRIKGRVHDAEDKPVSGVKIRVAPQTGVRHSNRKHRYDESGELDLEQMVISAVQARERQQAIRQEVLTDKDGVFAISGLGPGVHSVQALHQGYEFVPTYSSVTPDAEVDIEATELIVINCSVLLPGGTEPEYAILQCRRPTLSQGRSWSRADRVLRLREGEYDIRAESGPRNEFASRELHVTASPDLKTNLVFQLEAPTGITGAISTPKGDNGHYQVYAVEGIATSLKNTDRHRLMSGNRTAWVTPQYDNNYLIKNLPPGQYTVCINESGSGSETFLASAQTIVSNGLSVVNFDLPEPDRSTYAVVHVFGPDGKTLQDISINARVEAGTSQGYSYSSNRREDGAYWIKIPVLSGENNSARKYTLAIHSQKCGSTTVSYVPSAATELTVRLEKPASLKLHITGLPADTGRASIGLTAAGEDNPAAWSQIQADGVASFETLAPGDYEVSLYHSSGQVVLGLITLKSGDNEMTAPVPPLYTLTVIIDDPSINSRLTLKPALSGETRKQRRFFSATADKNGEAVFHALSAGAYSIETYNGSRALTMQVNIPDDSVVKFEAAKRNAISVGITDPGGYLATSGFQSGDMIVALNAIAFKEIGSLEQMLTGFKAMKRVYATVMRADKIFELELDVNRILQNNAGGTLTPTQIGGK